MKCIIFCLLIAVALAVPARYLSSDREEDATYESRSSSPNSYREEDDDATYESQSRSSGNYREDDATYESQSRSSGNYREDDATYESQSRYSSNREDEDATYESRSGHSSSSSYSPRSRLSSYSYREDDDEDATYESRSGHSSSSNYSPRSRLSSYSYREDDDEDATYESRSERDREDEDATYESRNDDDDDDDSALRENYYDKNGQQSQHIAKLSSYLDYLNDKYEGRGALKVQYSPPAYSYDPYSRTHHLGSLRFSYHAPDKYEESYRGRDYQTYKSAPRPYSDSNNYYKNRVSYSPNPYVSKTYEYGNPYYKNLNLNKAIAVYGRSSDLADDSFFDSDLRK